MTKWRSIGYLKLQERVAARLDQEAERYGQSKLAIVRRIVTDWADQRTRRDQVNRPVAVVDLTPGTATPGTHRGTVGWGAIGDPATSKVIYETEGTDHKTEGSALP